MKTNLARVNWKSLGNIKPAKRSHWTWNNDQKVSSGVRFIANPATTKAKSLVRVKLSKGRKAKLFRAPVVKPVVVRSKGNTTHITDRGNCTVHAFSNAAQVPYFVADRVLQGAGRVRGRGFNIAGRKVAGYKLANALRGNASIRQYGYVGLNEFLASHPIGRFYVQTNNHAFAVVHGKVVDNLPVAGGNRRLVNAWTITVNNRE
jgi:hypothetical protein